MSSTVMIYDGKCGLCRSAMHWVKRLDWFGRITYLDAQDWERVQARYPQLSPEAVLGLIHVVTADGRILIGYDGVRHLTGRLPSLLWLYPLLFLPGFTWLGPRVYAWVANHRYWFNRLFGRPDLCADGTCRVHHPR